MKVLNLQHPIAATGGWATYFQAVGAAKERLLLLDFDGTLAPFSEDRRSTRPYPGVADRLTRLSAMAGSRLIVISGRPVEELRRLLPLDPRPEMWGSHGWERLRSEGEVPETLPMARPMAEGLEEARAWSRREDLDSWMEFKPASVALHWRGREAGQMSRVRMRTEKYWSKLAKETGLQIHAFDGGLELRAPGRDKGSVVEELRAESGDDVAIAYLGDDLTDEDAFRALGDDGLKVLVRAELRPTAADLWIIPPGELLDFLDAWIGASEARIGARRSE